MTLHSGDAAAAGACCGGGRRKFTGLSGGKHPWLMTHVEVHGIMGMSNRNALPGTTALVLRLHKH